MSDLQTALLAIGVSVIVAVYAFGWWQQRRYRQKFDTAFKATHQDALYQNAVADQNKNQNNIEQAEQIPPLLDSAGVAAMPLQGDPCVLLDARTDFIIDLHLDEPSPSAALDGLWQRKFDFGKPVQVCGLTLTTQHWERVIADSQTLYAGFRIALQLVDRSGAISAAKLADFRDLVLEIATHTKASTTIPELNKTHHHAVELDAFCAAVDQMVGVNLVVRGTRLLTGEDIAQAANAQGMTLESDGAFHFPDAEGHSLFSLVNQNTQPFLHHSLERFSTPGITLLLDVPHVENPISNFDQMMRVAHALATKLQLSVVDDHGVVLSDSSLAHIRAQIAEVEAKMCDHGIEPGGAQAHRLFS